MRARTRAVLMGESGRQRNAVGVERRRLVAGEEGERGLGVSNTLQPQ